MFGFESFYSIFFLFLVAFTLVLNSFTRNYSDGRKCFCFIVFLLLFLLSALRGETVGGDLKRYIPEFNYIASVTNVIDFIKEASHEPLYLLYIKMLSFISDSPRCFLVGTSLLSLAGPMYMFYKHSNDPISSILIYFGMGYYTNTFNNVRQSLALSIVFFSISYLINRDFRKYLLLVLVATLFHYSAIIMLVLYPLSSRYYSIKRLLLYSFIGITLASLLSSGLFRYIALNFLVKYDPEAILEETSGGGYGMFAIYFVIFCIFAIHYFKTIDYIYSDWINIYNVLLSFIMVALIVQITAPVFHSMVRMTYFMFIPFITLSYSYQIENTKSQLRRDVVRLFYIALVLFFMNNAYSYKPDNGSNSQNTIPYVLIDNVIF